MIYSCPTQVDSHIDKHTHESTIWRRLKHLELHVVLNLSFDYCSKGEEMSSQAIRSILGHPIMFLLSSLFNCASCCLILSAPHFYTSLLSFCCCIFVRALPKYIWTSSVLHPLCCGFYLKERNFSISREHSPLCHWCTELIPFCWVEKGIYKEPWHFNQPNYLSLTSCSPPHALIYLSEIVRPGL